ncbi:MAG: DUF1800 domain-containing protein [Pirellulaceae bacterium]|nr:DUF1800 domain-containing protein [Planctomycetales bacterium]
MSDYWKRYEPSAQQPWDWPRVVHLHRRAGLGIAWEHVGRDIDDGPDTAIQRMLDGECASVIDPNEFRNVSQVIGDAAIASGDPERLKAWWWYRLIFAADTLRERATVMWHSHFATSNAKVHDLHLMQEQNEILRQHAFGPFREMLSVVVRHPAMLLWLDADSNRVGHANENLARELLELFTLGIGNYTEEDVKQAARCLTGWTVRNRQAQFREERFDASDKTVLERTGKFNIDDLLHLVCEQPATSRRLVGRICQWLMGENVVDAEGLEELAEGLQARDLDIGWAVETVLRSARFFSDDNICSRVSSPVDFIATAVRALGLTKSPPSTPLLASWSARMGQDLFYPPNVAGWPGGRAWLNSRTIVARANFASDLVAGRLRVPTEVPVFGVDGAGVESVDELLKFLPTYEAVLWGRRASDEQRREMAKGVAGISECVGRLLAHPHAYVN